MLRTKDQRVRLASRKQIRQIEHQMQSQHPDIHLMDCAAQKTTEFIEKHIMPYLPIDSILILIGPGNNGKDGICIANCLAKKGYSHIKICVLGEGQNAFLKRKLAKIPSYQVEVFYFEDSENFWHSFKDVSLIIDGLFGIGLSSSITDSYAKVIHWVNQSLLPILSLDIPSGLNCNTGRVMGTSIEAQWTTTYGLSKPGFYIWDGPRTVGELHCLDIGFPDGITSSVASDVMLFDKLSASNLLPERNNTSHKAQNGRVCIIAGKKGMWGAGILASVGSLRVGCGYATLASTQDPSTAVSEKPDILTTQFSSVKELLKHPCSIAVGPGLGVDSKTEDIIKELLSLGVKNVVLDADALNTIAQMENQKLDETWILTPHSGEMARLLKSTADEVDRDRIQAVKECSSTYGCHVLLKGYKTLLGYYYKKDFRLEVINSGNASLATAGTGDVLCGMIAGFIAQGLNTHNSGALGSYLHGTTADVWVKKGKAKNSMTASDVLDLIPEAFKQLLDEKQAFGQ